MAHPGGHDDEQKGLFRQIRSRMQYFRDPLLLFGILWASATIFSALQRLADFEMGRYFELLVSEFRRLSTLVADMLLFPFSVELPPIGDELLTIWILLAGITARTQQLKFKQNLEEFQRERGEEHFRRMRAKLRNKAWLCVPVNLLLWPLVVYSEMRGFASAVQILNPHSLYAHHFGEGIHPDLLKIFSTNSRILFILQWAYILICLIAFFLINTLEAYFEAPQPAAQDMPQVAPVGTEADPGG